MEKIKRFSTRQALKWGFKTFFDKIIFFLLIFLALTGTLIAIVLPAQLIYVYMAKLLGFIIVPNDTFVAQPSAGMLLLTIIYYLGVSFIGVFLHLGFTKVLLDLYENGTSSIKTLFSQGHLLLRAFVANILFSLLICLGMAFFIIPGIYFLVRYYFYFTAMVDKNLGIVASFEESSRLTAGARWTILGLAIVCTLIGIIPFLVFVAALANVYAYKKQDEYHRLALTQSNV